MATPVAVADALRVGSYFNDPLYLLCVVYLFAVPAFQALCNRYSLYTPYRAQWKAIISTYNFVLAAYSLASCLLMSFAIYRNGIFHMQEHADPLYVQVAKVFYWSKYVEFLDTAFLILAGKPVTWLQYLHHAGAPLDMGVHVLNQVPSAWIFVCLNGFIHTIMYTYYAFTILKWKFPGKQFITSLQLIQFFSGLGMTTRYLNVPGFWDSEVCRVAWTFNVAYVGLLILLFANFYFQTYYGKKRPRKEAAESAPAKAAPAADVAAATEAAPKLDWNVPQCVFLGLVHAVALYSLVCLLFGVSPSGRPVERSTLVLAASLWPISGLGITAGVHRLWSHRSYEAGTPLRIVLMLCNSMAMQGSIWHWARDHRTHHLHSDTGADPHDSNRGFFFAHVGCFLLKKDPRVVEAGRKCDLSDLKADPVVMFQKRADPWFSMFMCFAVPALLCGEDWLNGLLVAGFLRYAYVLHCTWCVNSVAHFFGSRAYAPKHEARESPLVSILAIGEGWHNWHHAFGWDYACAELGSLQQYNPTKMFIDLCCLLGLAWGRKRATRLWDQKKAKWSRDAGREVVETLRGPPLFKTRQVVVGPEPYGEDEQPEPAEVQKAAKLEKAPKDAKVPEVEKENAAPKAGKVVNAKVAEQIVIRYRGIAMDVTGWQNQHPGGSKVLKVFHERDATDAILAMHSEEALRKIEKMAAASKMDKQPLSQIQKDYGALVQAAKDEGLFKPCWFDEAFKASYSFGSFFAGAYVLASRPWTGAALIAFGWFQLGWLGHDWSHHTVLEASTTAWTRYCDAAGTATGVVRGTTLLWWKLRHNTHHVVTNQTSKDPDIRTAPALHFFDGFEPNSVTKWQAFYYLPLLGMLHLYWFLEAWHTSIKNLSSKNKHARGSAQRDTVGMTVHTVGMAYLAYSTGQWLAICAAYAMSGFGTAIVVFASHYAEPHIGADEKPGFLDQNLKTTRNIHGFLPWRLDDAFWFHLTGGLSHQVEHHLFPMMPRCNLRKMTPRVKELAKKHKLEYLESHLGYCTWLALKQLAKNVADNLRPSEVPALAKNVPPALKAALRAAQQPSYSGCLRLLFKCLTMAVFGILLTSACCLSQVVVPLGMVCAAVAVGWLDVIAKECKYRRFFPAKVLNAWGAWLFRWETVGAFWAAVGAYWAGAGGLEDYVWCFCKFGVVPVVLMQLNKSTLKSSVADGKQKHVQFVCPELNTATRRVNEMLKSIDQAPAIDVATVPVYNLSGLAEDLKDAVGAQLAANPPLVSAVQDLVEQTLLMRVLRTLLWPVRFLFREVFLWEKRDMLLHLIIATFIYLVYVGFSFFAWTPVCILFPMFGPRSKAAKALHKLQHGLCEKANPEVPVVKVKASQLHVPQLCFLLVNHTLSLYCIAGLLNGEDLLFGGSFKAQTGLLAVVFALVSVVGLGAVQLVWGAKPEWRAGALAKLLLMACQSVAMQGTVFSQARNKRSCDTKAWTWAQALGAQRRSYDEVDCKDLEKDWVLQLQRRIDPWWGLMLSYSLPGFLALLWGDTLWNGFLVAGVLRYTVMLYLTRWPVGPERLASCPARFVLTVWSFAKLCRPRSQKRRVAAKGDRLSLADWNKAAPTPAQVHASIPSHCLKRSTFWSTFFLVRDLALAAGVAALMHYAEDKVGGLALAGLWLVYAVVQGTVWTGLWVIGHECGHHAYSPSNAVSDGVGFVVHSALLVPFFSWQYTHKKHHRYTNHTVRGETHVPATRKGVPKYFMAISNALGEDAFALLNAVLHLLLGWPMYLLVNMTGGKCNWEGEKLNRKKALSHFWGSGSEVFPPQEASKVWLSALGVGAVLAGLAKAAQTYGVVPVCLWYGGPYLVTNAWLVLYTWLQHTHQDVPQLGAEDFSWLRGALCTIDRPYPWLVDHLHHHIGTTHVLHHVNHKVPHYHAVEATQGLEACLGDLYRYDDTPIVAALLRMAKECVFIEDVSGVQMYKGIGEAGPKKAAPTDAAVSVAPKPTAGAPAPSGRPRAASAESVASCASEKYDPSPAWAAPLVRLLPQ